MVFILKSLPFPAMLSAPPELPLSCWPCFLGGWPLENPAKLLTLVLVGFSHWQVPAGDEGQRKAAPHLRPGCEVAFSPDGPSSYWAAPHPPTASASTVCLLPQHLGAPMLPAPGVCIASTSGLILLTPLQSPLTRHPSFVLMCGVYYILPGSHHAVTLLPSLLHAGTTCTRHPVFQVGWEQHRARRGASAARQQCPTRPISPEPQEVPLSRVTFSC